jgi:CRP-like cAMP-binding protein
VIADGEITVTAGGRHLRTLTRGDGFGEIALLHAVPRTATCTATTETTLYALGRNDFLAAVTGHPRSADALEQLAASRLTAGASAVK